MNYIEVAVKVEPKLEGSDVLIATLSELAFESFVETETGFNAYITEEEFSEDEVQLALGDFEDIFKIEFKTKMKNGKVTFNQLMFWVNVISEHHFMRKKQAIYWM